MRSLNAFDSGKQDMVHITQYRSPPEHANGGTMARNADSKPKVRMDGAAGSVKLRNELCQVSLYAHTTTLIPQPTQHARKGKDKGRRSRWL
jgi:hypothetical protein